MDGSRGFGGHKKIYDDLLARIAEADIETLSRNLGLCVNEAGEAMVPFGGADHLISTKGVKRRDGKKPLTAAASALIHYLLMGSEKRPAGRFTTLSELASPLFKHGGYSASALERPIARRFAGRVPELLSRAASLGGYCRGEGGIGGLSLVFDLLPHIPVQLVFYDGDDEFPARATLLYDANAAEVIDFESLAVLATVFVNILTEP